MPTFVTVTTTSDIPDHSAKRFEVNGSAIAVFHEGGTFYAIDDECPCAGASLAQGYVRNGQVECGLHGFRFDLQSGGAAWPPKAHSVASYPLRVNGQEIQVALDAFENANRRVAKRNCSACKRHRQAS